MVSKKKSMAKAIAKTVAVAKVKKGINKAKDLKKFAATKAKVVKKVAATKAKGVKKAGLAAALAKLGKKK